MVISPVPVDDNAIPPVPDFKASAVVVVILPIVVLTATESVPILIAPPDVFNSNTPSASNNKVLSELMVISPIPVDDNAIPPVPEFISTNTAFNSTSVEAALPIVITLPIASIPILIAAVPSVSISKAPTELKVIPVSPASNTTSLAFISTLAESS